MKLFIIGSINWNSQLSKFFYENKEITDEYLKLKELEVQQKIIEKWNGQLPTTTTDTIPFLNIK